MLAVGVLAMVFTAMAFVQSTTARQTLALYGDARTLHRAHLVKDRLHRYLCMAQIGSAAVKDSGRTIEFYNPFLSTTPGTPVSAIKFEDGYACYYRDKTQSDPDHRTGLINDIEFEILGAGNAIRVTIKTLERYTWKLDRPYTLVCQISARN
ncbi:hypothetical protein AMJ85_09385 [candidate division BRC1 bacterium SM23_51]|nr:MAG: hypothetical protein AMJ85_09385 [candidate division BRC1 bacterium SM23_51]